MGTFIETQQALLSEEKQKRLEREEKQRIKARQEYLEQKLYFNIEIYLQDKKCNFFESKTIQETYKKLIEFKDEIILLITKDDKMQYFLHRKYLKILNECYSKYKNIKTINKEEEKEAEKEAERKLHKMFRGSFDFLQVNNRFGSHYFKSYLEVYNFLLKPTTQNQIIECITQNQNIKYLLNKKYLTILNNTYKQYKLLINQKTITQKQITPKIEATKTEKAAAVGGAVLLETFKIIAIVILTPLAFITSLIIHKR